MTTFPTLTQPAAYRIRIVGHVSKNWSDYLADVQETVVQEGSDYLTELTGIAPDQSALYGLLCYIRDLGLVLFSVEYLANLDI